MLNVQNFTFRRLTPYLSNNEYCEQQHGSSLHSEKRHLQNKLHEVFNHRNASSEKHTPIFRYNIKLELIKFLFNETKYYSNMNDSLLFKRFSIHPGFSSQQLTNIDFHFEIQKYYKENYYNPEIEVGNYNELSKVHLWFSYDSPFLQRTLYVVYIPVILTT